MQFRTQHTASISLHRLVASSSPSMSISISSSTPIKLISEMDRCAHWANEIQKENPENLKTLCLSSDVATEREKPEQTLFSFLNAIPFVCSTISEWCSAFGTQFSPCTVQTTQIHIDWFEMHCEGRQNPLLALMDYVNGGARVCVWKPRRFGTSCVLWTIDRRGTNGDAIQMWHDNDIANAV